MQDGKYSGKIFTAILRKLTRKKQVQPGGRSTQVSTAVLHAVLNTAAANPPLFVVTLQNFTIALGFGVDEWWIDIEVMSVSAGTTAGANQMHALMQQGKPTFRYVPTVFLGGSFHN